MTEKEFRLAKSKEIFYRAQKVIPLASQTFSKSFIQYPMNNAPRFVERGEGCYLFDVDGNRYIDLVSGLAAIILGYCDPDVDRAVKDQLKKGTIFSLPHELEVELAEKIVRMSPNAEQVRFGKNGSDVTTGAIRLARSITGRDRIAVCGYHGWHDWYIGSTSMQSGIPRTTAELTHSFDYNNADSLACILESYPNQFAAVILEPANISAPNESFLFDIRSLAHQHGALLIFDETITGFRYGLGGAQEKYGISADLVTYGKALANGFPLSALVGPREYMKHLEKVFFSFTFGGEALSLAASLATLSKLESEKVPSHLAERGTRLKAGISTILSEKEMEEFCTTGGEPCWFFMLFKDCNGVSSWEIKTLFMQEMLRRGVLTMGAHNLTFAHNEHIVDELLSCYRSVLPLLHDAVRNSGVRELIDGKALEPLFTIRKS